MRLEKRVLWICEDPAELEAQLEGKELGFSASRCPKLQYGVNTDAMISGAASTLGYRPEVLGPYFLESFKEVVKKGSVKNGGFQIVVGGDAYGSGSSREVAVVAHQGAGIELVVARSFQRIFQENMVYSGLPFTSDLGVLERLERGEEVELPALARELPPFFRAVAE